MTKVFLDANYIIYMKYAEDDEIYEYCVELLKKLDEDELYHIGRWRI